jgi:predicted permease
MTPGGAPDSSDRILKRVFRVLTFRPNPKQEVREELDFHLSLVRDELERKGLSPHDARREAERRFGDVSRYRKELEDMEEKRVARRRWTEGLGTMVLNLRLALRTLRKAPGFSAGVVLTMALGIGANATMFGILDRLLLSPPEHVAAPEQIKRIYLQRMFIRNLSTSPALTYPDFLDLKSISAFSSVAAWTFPQEYTLGSGADAERVTGVLVSGNFFSTLGVTPRLGRFFSSDDDRVGAPLTTVLGHGFWQRRFGGDPSVLGRTLPIRGMPMTVIGVAPRGFTGLNLREVDVWFPMVPMQALRTGGTDWETSRGWWWLRTAARLSPGSSVQAAEEEATALHLQAREDRIAKGRYDPYARILLGSLIAARGPSAQGLSGRSSDVAVARWLTGVSVLVLLIACANVANLILARAVDRSREVAVRLAMGVSRVRLLGQMATETLALAFVGGLVALALAYWGGGIVRETLLPDVHWSDAGLGGRVISFTLAVTVLAGLLAALLPALQAGRANVSRVLAGGGRGSSTRRSGLRVGLTVVQASLSVLLLVGAGLFVKSLDRVRDKDLGLEVDQVAVMTLEFQERELETEEVNLRYAQALEALTRLPGVTRGARTSSPFAWAVAEEISVPGRDSIPRLPGGGPYFQTVDPEYFATLGLDILAGRALEEADALPDSRVMLVSQTMAEALWPHESPLGQCVKRGGQDQPCTTVVGVVEDASRGAIEEDPFMQYYLPMAQAETTFTTQGAYLHFTTDSDGAIGLLQRAALDAAPGIRFAEIKTLRQILDPQARSWQLGATMFSVFGLLALLVAGVGLYSVLAYDVARRSRELGVRAAVGARRGGLVAMVMGEGVRLTLAGLVVGFGLALLAGPWVAPLLYDVSPRDPLIFCTVGLALFLVAVLASGWPALRASRVDPVEALKAE